MKFLKLFLLFASFILFCLNANAQLKKRIAVSTFEDRSGGSYNSVGDGIADMLVTALVKSKSFIVLERKELEKVMHEQQFGESGLVTPETAPKIGKILGVELMVVGSVSEFGLKESEVSGGFSAFGAGLKTRTARVAVDIRLINTTT